MVYILSYKFEDGEGKARFNIPNPFLPREEYRRQWVQFFNIVFEFEEHLKKSGAEIERRIEE